MDGERTREEASGVSQKLSTNTRVWVGNFERETPWWIPCVVVKMDRMFMGAGSIASSNLLAGVAYHVVHRDVPLRRGSRKDTRSMDNTALIGKWMAGVEAPPKATKQATCS